MIGQILSTMLPVFLIAGCGALYGRYRTPDIQGLNVLNMELFVPMLVFAVLADQQAPLQEYARLALAATVVVLGSGIVLYPLAKVLKLNLKTFLPPMMFNNSGNMGIPLLVLAFGDEALPAEQAEALYAALGQAADAVDAGEDNAALSRELRQLRRDLSGVSVQGEASVRRLSALQDVIEGVSASLR